MTLAASVIAVMDLAMLIYDLNLFQVGFQDLEVLPEKQLKIFILVQPHPGMVWG